VIFSFINARNLRGGKFGKGMGLIAWGFLVMALGHLHMQIEMYYGFDLFGLLLGPAMGRVAWFTALVITWGLSGLGFYHIWKATKA
ncbi:MAG: hypothetical protein AAGA66_00575, partial [Bacteroidota bacterium]